MISFSADELSFAIRSPYYQNSLDCVDPFKRKSNIGQVSVEHVSCELPAAVSVSYDVNSTFQDPSGPSHSDQSLLEMTPCLSLTLQNLLLSRHCSVITAPKTTQTQQTAHQKYLNNSTN